MKNVYLGLDIGSISVNAVVMDADKNILFDKYTYCQGRPFEVLKDTLQSVMDEYGSDNIQQVAITGTGGKAAVELIGGAFVNEIIAQSSSVAELHPEVKTVIEMGGEDSKLISMETREAATRSTLCDFTTNSLCAAGTGSFLDQQANRIGVSIEKEFGDMAMQSEKPSRIAGRCSVFAKSDMIHLQQIATPVADIVAGLCFAVARNFKSSLGRGKVFEKPISFQGGVAANQGVIRAFKEVLELKDEDLIIPKNHASMGAIGAVLYLLENNSASEPFKGTAALLDYLENRASKSTRLEQLEVSKAVYNKELREIKPGEKVEVSLGIDIGSLSTNVVLIDEDDRVVARRYLPTASKPINAVQRGLKEIAEEVGDSVIVKSVGTTGSGRYLTGDFIGADSIQNEITAQATAAIAYDPTVDTIFEIGGQDSKYIRIEDGVVVDFEMNKVCAAGTGSFIEEQSEKLDINIIKEFGETALGSKQPVKLGNRCTVFMESDLNSFQQKGASKEDLVGGLAYSIVSNYIQKVVGDKPVGNKIFFQGGVTNNKAVVAAFEKVTGKSITIPPHFDVTGAIGSAMLARKSMSEGQQTRFKGFQVSETPFSLNKFTCKSCSNSCEIQRVVIEGADKSLFYGGRCDMYDVDERKGKGKDIPNLFLEKEKMLVGDYVETPKDDRISIGIPRGLMIFYSQFPFWRTFFNELNFRLVVSDETDKKLVTTSLELMAAETCFPVEVIHGHVQNLLDKGVDHVFLPFIVNAKATDDNPTNNCNCPWIQAHPFMINSAYANKTDKKKFLTPTLHFRFFGRVLNQELSDFMNTTFGTSKDKVKAAITKADKAQSDFADQVAKRGAEVMADLPKDKKVFVILGRPYNTGDPMLNLDLIKKLINLDVLPLPIDYLPLKEEDIFEDYPMMYWPNGQRILSASRIIRKQKNLFALFISNFRCGPDSFLTHYVREEMLGKPYLHLEVDEHSADAGLITRCEAFLDSLEGYTIVGDKTQPLNHNVLKSNGTKERTIYFPYARDSVYAVAAASKYCGKKTEVLPMQDETDLELARKNTNGQECFPFICTTGSFLKKLAEKDCDPETVSFFMPDHTGPCRFGEYGKLQKIIFNRLGYKNVEILAPSNENSYAGMDNGHGTKWRKTCLKGFVAIDLLRKMQQETRPYEINKGQTNEVYKNSFARVIGSLETGSKQLPDVLEQAAQDFKNIAVDKSVQKPVIAIVGEIFMRDNPFCSSFLVDRLEALGAETIMAPFAEWISYSTYRYRRDSIWKRDIKGLFKSKLQSVFEHALSRKLVNSVESVMDLKKDVEIKEMLENCTPYIHRDYDGDPPLAMGTASVLAKGDKIAGVVNILPFTCMPGTLNASVSGMFRKDHNNIPWENIAYDGQEDTGIETRLQAFMYQANEYLKKTTKRVVMMD